MTSPGPDVARGGAAEADTNNMLRGVWVLGSGVCGLGRGLSTKVLYSFCVSEPFDFLRNLVTLTKMVSEG